MTKTPPALHSVHTQCRRLFLQSVVLVIWRNDSNIISTWMITEDICDGNCLCLSALKLSERHNNEMQDV